MAYFRHVVSAARKGWIVLFIPLTRALCSGFLLTLSLQAQNPNNGLYVIKQYPDGTRTKVKWSNVSLVEDRSGQHGGAPAYRPAKQGEWESLPEEMPAGTGPPVPGEKTPDPATVAAEPAPPIFPERRNPLEIPASKTPAVSPVRQPGKSIWSQPGERSALPARMGPSVEYGQAYQDYGTAPLRLDPRAPVLRPEQKEAAVAPELAEPFLSSLEGVVLVGEASRVVPQGLDQAPGVRSEVSFLRESRAEMLLRPFLQKPVSMKTLAEMRKALLGWLHSQGRQVVNVVIPEQEIKNGIVQILVLEGKMGVVWVDGNRYFSTENLQQQIRQKPGEGLDLEELGEDAGWLNSNPFRQVDVSLAPGGDPGTTDVMLEVKDRFPLRPFVSYDNFGVQTLGYDRYSLGLTLMDVWSGLDQKFDYQYLTSGGFSKLKANSGAWSISLPWRHTASVFGSYSLADPDASGQLDFSSYYWQTSFRYNFLLPDLDLERKGFGWRHQAYVGFDFKAANSDVFFAGAPVPPSTNGLAGLYNIAQFPFGYTATITDPLGSTGVECAGFWSPGGLTGDNSDASFQQINGGATADYLYGKFLLNRVFVLPENISLVGNLQVQQSNRTLMPTESFGIGGYDTVRGYDQRAANGDNAYLFNVELRSPGISFGREWGDGEFPDQLVLLGFFDYGQVLQVSSDTTTSVNWTLASVGPGLRYSIGPWFQVRFDWGFQLKQAPPGTTGGTGGRAGTSQAVLSASLAY